MADEGAGKKPEDFMGPQDAERAKAKEEALRKVGPSKISLELKQKQEMLAKQRDAARRNAAIINFFLIAIPIGIIVYSFMMEDKKMAMTFFKWGLILLFTLLPGFMIIRAIFFKKSSF